MGKGKKTNLIEGRFHAGGRGYGFVIPSGGDLNDVFIPAENVNGAMHNDTVAARITKKASNCKKAEGEIVKIHQRANKTLVGTFEAGRYFGFVTPDNARISGDIFIPKDEFGGAKPGDKVVVELMRWPESRRNAEGRVIEVLGAGNDLGVDILSIIKEYGLSGEFPEKVVKQAEMIPDAVTGNMINGRRDLRNLRMVTIDGEDAKDLDDAVSIEKLPDGKFRLGVHIADVSHYVPEGSPLDKEALKRGTSVYLVDRVIPMLPEKLSNGICSLNPGVDRLTFTVMMDIDTDGRMLSHEIFESVINIDERMTYTDVYKILEEGDAKLAEKYSSLIEDFKAMKELAQILRGKRLSRGAIDFDFAEVKIILDEKGKPVEVKRYEITIANRIIEEFMLVCNETVAEHFRWLNTPFVYRIHEDPDPEKIAVFAEFVHNLGYRLKGLSGIRPGALQELLEKSRGTKEEALISTVMLRSLAKARYSHRNTGHFGLAAEFYCHFTSPIRRYPDLMIHRIMKEYLKGTLTPEREKQLNEKLPEISAHCSERERAADEAERETENLKKVEFMKQHEGEIFKGVISGATSFGIFVELENTVEGLVKMSSLEDDYYIFDEKRYCIIGEGTRKTYRIGDGVTVRLVKADVPARKIEFMIVEDEGQNCKNGGETFAGGNGKRRRRKSPGAGSGKKAGRKTAGNTAGKNPKAKRRKKQ